MFALLLIIMGTTWIVWLLLGPDPQSPWGIALLKGFIWISLIAGTICIVAEWVYPKK